MSNSRPGCWNNWRRNCVHLGCLPQECPGWEEGLQGSLGQKPVRLQPLLRNPSFTFPPPHIQSTRYWGKSAKYISWLSWNLLCLTSLTPTINSKCLMIVSPPTSLASLTMMPTLPASLWFLRPAPNFLTWGPWFLSEVILSPVFLFWGGCNKPPPTGDLKQQKLILSQFWRLEVQNQGVKSFAPSKVPRDNLFSPLPAPGGRLSSLPLSPHGLLLRIYVFPPSVSTHHWL